MFVCDVNNRYTCVNWKLTYNQQTRINSHNLEAILYSLHSSLVLSPCCPCGEQDLSAAAQFNTTPGNHPAQPTEEGGREHCRRAAACCRGYLSAS